MGSISRIPTYFMRTLPPLMPSVPSPILPPKLSETKPMLHLITSPKIIKTKAQAIPRLKRPEVIDSSTEWSASELNKQESAVVIPTKKSPKKSIKRDKRIGLAVDIKFL